VVTVQEHWVAWGDPGYEVVGNIQLTRIMGGDIRMDEAGFDIGIRDSWRLCAVRLVKTRPIATQLCEGGHVRVNGNAAKPSTKVRAGDVVQALIAERERILEVVRPIETRVGAPVAATCYVDNSPPPAVSEVAPGIKVLRGLTCMFDRRTVRTRCTS